MVVDNVFIALGFVLLYGIYAASGIFPGDAGDLVSAAVTGGIPHPPGYPLYTFIGWVIAHVPVSTPAWRMVWLSIIPHAATLVLVYMIAYRLMRHRMASLYAVCVLAGNYVFFLYSTTPEVFALLDFFVAALLYLAVSLHARYSDRLFYLFCFVVGLSFTHHPFIVLLLPSLFLLVFARAVSGKRAWRRGILGASWLAGGLVPYAYVFFAARWSSIINWDRPITLSRFFQLVTRADYGSFMSGSMVGHTLVERFLNVKAYIGFLILDYTWVGIFLALVGIVWVWRKNHDFAVSFILGFLLMGPAFSFYSSFPIVNRFVLGTVERFSLPGYVLIAPLAGIGSVVVSVWMAARFRFMADTAKKRRVLVLLFYLVFSIYPVSVGAMTLWRFAGLSGDRTTDNYARDVLKSAPEGSIVLLTRDTPLFSVQYMRYATGYRSDTYVVHTARLPFIDYHEVIRRVFPTVLMPQATLRETPGYVVEFIKENRAHHPIASNVIIPLQDDWVWVPHGMVYVLTLQANVPPLEKIISENRALWQSFHSPATGLLSRYNHLFLTNVLDEYAISSNEYGTYLLKKEMVAEAKRQFERAVSYGSDTQQTTAWMYIGLSNFLLKDCNGALDAYQKAQQPSMPRNAALLYYQAITYRDCVGDAVRAKELFSQYEEIERQQELPLERPQ